MQHSCLSNTIRLTQANLPTNEYELLTQSHEVKKSNYKPSLICYHDMKLGRTVKLSLLTLFN